MDYSVSATRLTLYAFISSVEIDLRNFIINNITEYNEKVIIDPDLLIKLKSRSGKDDKFENDVLELLQYTDFGDCVSLLSKYSKFIPKSFANEIEDLYKDLIKIIPIRNRVMHSRPLEYEDMPVVLDFIKVINKFCIVNWSEVASIKDKIEKDPSMVFGLKIPKIHDYIEQKILHNLPEVEFDDTGFVGRKNEREKIIKQLLSSNYPVISIIGDGGVGKTALVLRCLYDVIDEPSQEFDAIVWVSLKTRVLNSGEFININNAITNALSMFNEVSSILSGDSYQDIEHLTSNIIQYMENFRILLVLDNLETINSDNIRNFLRSIPLGSKVIITSRIGIGEFESREILEGLGKKERVYYLRRLASNFKLKDLLKFSDEELDNNICKKLHSNPLAIKWFVINLLKGEPMKSILMHTEQLTEYCMSNVHDKLTDDARTVLEVLLIANKHCSDAELNYLLDLDPVMHRKALNELITTNFVKMETIASKNEIKTMFYISDFAREYLQQHCKPNNTKFIIITKKIRTLKGLTQDLDIENEINPYNPKSITINSEDEKIAAYYLRQALVYSSNDDFMTAFEFIDKAKSAVPNYYEIYKISGFIHAANKNYFIANSEYLTAIESNRDYAPLLYLYAGFKLSYMEDFEGALEYCLAAEKIDSNNINIILQKARILKQMGKFNDANIIFKQILDKADELKLKTKRIAVDQAADNFKRWAEKSINEEDYNNSLELLQNSIKIISILDNIDKDNKICTTLINIIRVTCMLCFKTNCKCQRYLDFLILIFDKYIDIIKYSNRYDSCQMPIKALFPYLKVDDRDKLEKYLIVPLKELSLSVKNKNEGYISNKFGTYGFIINSAFKDGLYFYWQDVISDFLKLSVGDKVRFIINRNEKGFCAKEINVIDDFS